jgi:hypothetical protein
VVFCIVIRCDLVVVFFNCCVEVTLRLLESVPLTGLLSIHQVIHSECGTAVHCEFSGSYGDEYEGDKSRPLKRRSTSTTVKGAIYQKAAIFRCGIIVARENGITRTATCSKVVLSTTIHRSHVGGREPGL